MSSALRGESFCPQNVLSKSHAATLRQQGREIPLRSHRPLTVPGGAAKVTLS